MLRLAVELLDTKGIQIRLLDTRHEQFKTIMRFCLHVVRSPREAAMSGCQLWFMELGVLLTRSIAFCLADGWGSLALISCRLGIWRVCQCLWGQDHPKWDTHTTWDQARQHQVIWDQHPQGWDHARLARGSKPGTQGATWEDREKLRGGRKHGSVSGRSGWSICGRRISTNEISTMLLQFLRAGQVQMMPVPWIFLDVNALV